MFTSGVLVAADVIQRLVVAPWVKLRPTARIPVLGRWIKIMAWVVTRPVAFIGGCTIPRPDGIVPTEPGMLILMNHQSLFDIPLVVQTVAEGYPRIVTRERYSKWIPLISQMVRLYQYPVVDPTANREVMRASLEELGRTAQATDVPLGKDHEGTRTKDGEIGHFKRGGLTRILASRPWTVYVFVADGFWKTARYKQFVRGLTDIRGTMEHVATLDWQDPAADPNPFLDRVHVLMAESLRGMRDGAEVA
jgi:1-acyl-sn-glycerol-3-phosphate acyltransferase